MLTRGYAEMEKCFEIFVCPPLAHWGQQKAQNIRDTRSKIVCETLMVLAEEAEAHVIVLVKVCYCGCQWRRHYVGFVNVSICEAN
ncbi:hypothetical protein SUGI_0373900 [Cryptomeria japonica]|nr:hypothetical protein SUGI_0373900 [Cryptomeria japonica]